jgi:hypothetical protein
MVLTALAGSSSLMALGGPQAPSTPGQNPAAVTTTLKLTVVISRFNGDKKVGSLPFVVMVVPGYDRDHDGSQSNLQMGAEVPMGQTTRTDEKNVSSTSWSYRSIGTSLVASSKGANDVGQYSVNLQVNDSQVMSDNPDVAKSARPASFQNFSSNSRLLLRDGQTVQYTAATDKTSGEVAKLDVTLNVIK